MIQIAHGWLVGVAGIELATPCLQSALVDSNKSGDLLSLKS